MRPHLHPLPGLALLLGLALLQACSDAPPGPVPQEPALMRVRVLNLQNSHSAASLSLPGRIVAREPVALRPAVAGLRVEQVLVDAGDWVRAGQALVQMDARAARAELEQARQGQRRAQAQAEAAQAQWGQVQERLALARDAEQRYREAAALGAVSEQERRERRSSLAQLERELQAAEQQQQAARAEAAAAGAQLALARQRLDDTVLRAPRSGRLGERQVERGLVSDPQTALPWFVLSEDGDREFEAWAEVQRLEGLAPGMPASVQLDAAGLKPLPGTLRSLEAGQGQESRRARLRVALTPGLRLPLGVSASVTLTGPPRAGLALPPEALQFDPRPWVFVVDEQQRLRKRYVRLSADQLRALEGLQPGERLVRSAAPLLSEGQRVQPVSDAVSAPAGAAP